MQPENGGDRNQEEPQQQQQWLQIQQQQQQWMAMQYQNAAAVSMQHQMLYAQQYMAYHQQPESHLHSQQQSSEPICDDNKTVWVGDLHHWMDENYLYSCFAHTGEVISAKIIRNKQSGQPEGYGFVEFFSHAGAEKVLQCYNGILMPNTEQPFRLNWASFNAYDRRLDGVPDYSIFVGDLAPDVTDKILQETFSCVYSSVKGAKVVMDPNTGRSKGYGFVRFSDENEKSRSITEMNGMYCLSRPMRCSIATPKKSPGYQQQFPSQALILTGGYAANGFALHNPEPDYDSSNTTIFVGGLHSEVTEEELREPFSEFGEVLSVKIPVGKGCGFVQFSERNSAMEAIERLNGVVIGNQAVRLSWGRNAANRQLNKELGGEDYYGNGHTMQHDNQDQPVFATTQVS